MVNTMARVADAFWRAVAYCLHPQVILLSLAPLILSAGITFGLGWFFWEAAVDGVRHTMEQWQILNSMLGWLDYIGANGFRSVLAPLVVLALALPVVIVISLLLVALMMTPALVNLVARRRYAALERKHGTAVWIGALWGVWNSLLALVALVVSMPFWLIPPLVLIVPPLIWGWLGYRVFSFDALSDHASKEERRQIMREHRIPLLTMGLVTGYLSALPAAIWAIGVAAVVLAPFLIVASIWLHMLVFAFSTLWFTHYCMTALHELRLRQSAVPPATQMVVEVRDEHEPLLPNPDTPLP
ncbi:EI24 domain-containing protein [Pelomonas sp. KK5]|uniref:EI24 domain-containing protein n=1 Tax=Pelomonas sp. KK5 TaxID=1855730 RepID=UPI001E478700|nr:EI24 domain-containing protein [Pelomonas sp. KK5]